MSENPIPADSEVPVDAEFGPCAEEIEVLKWRIEQLRGLGFEEQVAMQLACDFQVDLGLSRQLIGAGCSHELAAQIVT